ncbi:MAG: hypothetical protein K5679_00180 [Lachnospiraceae bacterium]|nr:hypothetical protein [Lachnospiraceae bacterium]
MLIAYRAKDSVLRNIISDMEFALKAKRDWEKSVSTKEPDEQLQMLLKMYEGKFIESLNSSKIIGALTDEEQTLLYNIYLIEKENMEEM